MQLNLNRVESVSGANQLRFALVGHCHSPRQLMINDFESVTTTKWHSANLHNEVQCALLLFLGRVSYW